MTATPAQPYSPSEPRVPRVRRAVPPLPPRPGVRRARGVLRDVLALVGMPLVAALVLPAAFAGGGTRRWFGGRA
ncbi:hypothetical protein B7767_22440, partial [Streptomyces sp. 13-12-16]